MNSPDKLYHGYTIDTEWVLRQITFHQVKEELVTSDGVLIEVYRYVPVKDADEQV